MISAEDTATLIQAIKDNAERLGLTWKLSYATVKNGDDTTNVKAVFDAPTNSDVVQVPMVSLVGQLQAGVRVAVISVPPAGQYIVGVLNAVSAVPVYKTTYGQHASSNSTTSFSYADVGVGLPFVFPFYKYRNETDLLIQMHTSAFVSGSSAQPTFALSNGTQIVETGRMVINTLTAHQAITGVSRLIGAPAGQQTLRLQWIRLSGTGTVFMNTDDTTSIAVTEIAPL